MPLNQFQSELMDTLALTRQLGRSHKTSGEAHLKFQLNQQTPAVFSMKHVQEVLVLPVHRLTPMPNMLPCMLGLMNRRSRVLWLVDLAQLLGISRLNVATRHYNMIIIRVGHLSLGLVVHQVEGMTWLQKDTIQSPLGQTTAGLVPYLQGCVLQEKEILLVLDAEAIAQSPALRNPGAIATETF